MEGLLEILKALLVTEDLFLLPNYAENEWLYRLIAAERDLAKGTTIEGPWDLGIWETDGLKGDIDQIRKDMEMQRYEAMHFRSHAVLNNLLLLCSWTLSTHMKSTKTPNNIRTLWSVLRSSRSTNWIPRSKSW